MSSSFIPPKVQLGNSEIDHFEISNYSITSWPDEGEGIKIVVNGLISEIILNNLDKGVKRADEQKENEVNKSDNEEIYCETFILFYISNSVNKPGFTQAKGICTYPRLYSFMNKLETEIPKMWNRFKGKDELQNKNDETTRQINSPDASLITEKVQIEESEVEVWEQIPQHYSDQLIIKLWCEGNSNIEIGRKVSMKPVCVTNLICKLRKKYHQIPYDKQRKRAKILKKLMI